MQQHRITLQMGHCLQHSGAVSGSAWLSLVRGLSFTFPEEHDLNLCWGLAFLKCSLAVHVFWPGTLKLWWHTLTSLSWPQWSSLFGRFSNFFTSLATCFSQVRSLPTSSLKLWKVAARCSNGSTCASWQKVKIVKGLVTHCNSQNCVFLPQISCMSSV